VHRGCEGPQPSKPHRSSLRGPNGHCWPILWRASAVGAVKECGYRCAAAARDRSPPSPTDHRCHDRMAIVGRSSGGRPLRRRRERVWISLHGGCEGPQPKPPPIIVAPTGWPLLADPLEGVRSVGAVKECRLSRKIRLTQNAKPFADERGPAAFMVIQVKRHG
jgi:hypothetical protein